MRALIAFALLLLSTTASAQDKLALAVKELGSAPVFAFGGVGFAGRTSTGELAFRFILAQPAPVALASFEKVLHSGNAEAIAYALIGIHKLDPKRFAELDKTAPSMQGVIRTENGCIISKTSLSVIVKSIDAGNYDSVSK